MKTFAATMLLSALMVSACQSKQAQSPQTPMPTETTSLEGTNWTLVEIQSPDDKTGTVRPDASQTYTMSLASDGKVSMQLNCNRGMGTWMAASAGGTSGSFSFGPISTTKALCQPPSLDQQIARDATYVRSYVLENDKLYLNLMADGGNYVWQKSPN